MPADFKSWLMAGGALKKAGGETAAAPVQSTDSSYLAKQIAMNPNNSPAGVAPVLPAAPTLGPYDTKLAPDDEQKFTAWKAVNAPKDLGEDYDLRGLYKSGLGLDARGHATDQFKKPNHPTFSTLSQYHGKDDNVGGEWIDHGGKSFFLPSATNLKNQSVEDLQNYFNQQEPNTVLLPPRQLAPRVPAQAKPSPFSPLLDFISRVMVSK